MMTNFLILHGLGGSTGGHWQEWLSDQLKTRGHRVYFPQFPDWDRPDKERWLHQLKAVFSEIPENEPLSVVAHSLGCILWIHYAADAAARKVNRAILVSPPSPFRKVEAVRDFFPLPDDKGGLKRAAKKTLLVFSSDDPFLPPKDAPHYFGYGVPCMVLPEMGHINVPSGYGPWPGMLHFCLDDKLFLSDLLGASQVPYEEKN
ncbi:alpha/beta fold hydrolase [Sporolactobacillus sp. THM7-7]|nr:alpha/beta fold hydrolase [Sporolactobacillus sp. THM7-7]